MLFDLRSAGGHAVTDTDVCIVGGGAAGITVARELSGRTIDVVVLEAGGLRVETDTQALYRGENVGLPYELHRTRVRCLGGTTEAWGGWCKPLAALDFAERPWVAHSGWPIDRAELDHWYTRANAVCQAGPYDYALERWRERLGGTLGELRLTGGAVQTELAQLTGPTRFGRRYRDELAAAENVRVYVHANAFRVVTDRTGATAERVEARTLDGERLTVLCRFVVLAAGGVENARLLLLSRGAGPAGLGNANDLVGRFFADHPRVEAGEVELANDVAVDLYDPLVAWRRRRSASPGTYDRALVAAGLALTEEAQRCEQLLNYRAWIVHALPGHGSEAVEASQRLYRSVRARKRPHRARAAIAAVARRPHAPAAALVGRLVRPRWLVRGHRLVNIVEPEPLAESRVTLSDSVDALGMRKVRLDWRVGELVPRTVVTAHALLDEELRRAGIGKVVRPLRAGQHDRFRTGLRWVWHHMGTTRMHSDDAHGVVDADCRVHSTSNVYVAGSSVFPTAGNDMPTLTIVALAIRLADHLARTIEGRRGVMDVVAATFSEPPSRT